jgi:ribosomal protein S6E (S10)
MKAYTAAAIVKGKTLEPWAVAMAQSHCAKRRAELLSRNRVTLTPKERGEARRLTGRWDFWNAEVK